MQLLALLLIGFSLFAAALLVAGTILNRSKADGFGSKTAGLALIVSLAALQGIHLHFIEGGHGWVFSKAYVALLYCVAPSFYFYSRRLLAGRAGFGFSQLLHAVPVSLGPLMPQSIALPGAFLAGCGYLLWLASVIYGMRGQRRRFKLELLALAGFFAIALAIVVLGFIKPLLSDTDFVAVYSIFIGLAFFAAALTLLRFPAIEAEVAEAARASYAESTLKNVDREAVLRRLDKLMREDKIYTLETLSLGSLAEQLDLTPHQLSELINTELQQGFSQFVRRYRIEEAQRQLLAEPDASVLSIGLSVGFSTQSNFYAAFKEIAGTTPGQFRKYAGKSR
ncbi:MAG: helix-turn-helix domain-containing protein [Gammaproteobacteria bacterium]